MEHRLDCGSCGGAVPFEEWEQGTDVYCPQCGRPSRVPLADDEPISPPGVAEGEQTASRPEPPTAAEPGAIAPSDQRPAPTVFQEKADLHTAQRVVGELDCPRCAAKVPITVTDYGGSTYCPACGAEVPVGEAFVIRSTPSPVVVPPRPAEQVPAPLRRSRLELAAAALIAAAGMIWLVQSSTRKVESSPAPAPRVVNPPPSPAAQITLRAIEALGAVNSPAEALAQAEDWRQDLVDLKVAETDPRIAKLDAVIALLKKKLIPEPPPDPPEIAKFLDQVRQLTEELKKLTTAKRPDDPALTAGRAAIARAGALIAQHPDVLGPIAGTFRDLSTQFREIATRLEGTKPIEALLETTKQHVDAGRATEALESLAQAQLLALSTILSDSQREDLTRRLGGIVAGPLQLAKCRRSLEQAEQAAHTGDAPARDWLVRDAQSQLDAAAFRAPGANYDALIARLKPLKEAESGGASQSTRIAEFEARRSYEKALESFATWQMGETDRWIECARDFDEVARQLPDERAAWANQLATLLLQGLRARLDMVRDLRLGDAGTAEALQGVSRVLAAARRWESRGDYRSLLVEIDQHGSEIGHRLLEQAERQLQEDGPEKAMELARAAEGVASAPDKRRSRELIELSRKAIGAREDLKAQEDAWTRVKAIVEKHESAETWVALARFEKRHPKSRHATEITEIRRTIEPEIRRQIPVLLLHCDALAREQKFADYRIAVNRLLTFPHKEGDPEFRKHSNRLEELDRDVENRFREIPKRMATRSDLLAVLRQLTDILALNPSHPGALARRQEAWNRARPFAANMLRTAELTAQQHRLPEAQRQSQLRALDDLLTLAEPGPVRDRARELRKSLDQSPAPGG